LVLTGPESTAGGRHLSRMLFRWRTAATIAFRIPSFPRLILLSKSDGSITGQYQGSLQGISPIEWG